MKELEYRKPMKVSREVDVLVVGGGPGGVGAAISAARAGAKTLLIERENCLGGMMTSGLVNTFDYNDERLYKGLYLEMVDKLRARNAITTDSWVSRTYEPEAMKRLLDELCLEAGVEVLFKTTFVDAIVEDDCIKGAVISCLEGTSAVLAHVVIDCTCVGCVAMSAKAKLHVCPDDTRENLMNRFTVRNVDLARVMNLIAEDSDYYSDCTVAMMYPRNMGYNGLIPHTPVVCGGQRDFKRACERGEYAFDRWPTVFHGNITCDGKVEFLQWVRNTDGAVENEKGRFVAAYCDKARTFDADVQASLEMGLREQANAMTDYLRTHVRGFERVVLDITSNGPGLFVHHLKGRSAVTLEEMFQGATHEDSIMVGYGFIDSVSTGRRMDTLPIDVSYGALYSENIRNLMAAGFMVSADGQGQLAIWTQPTCLTSGQAAGTAAAMAAKAGISVSDVDVKALQACLREQNVVTSCHELARGVMEDYLDGAADIKRRRANGEKDQKIRNV